MSLTATRGSGASPVAMGSPFVDGFPKNCGRAPAGGGGALVASRIAPALSRQGIGFDGKFGSFDSWAYPDFQLMRAAAKDDAVLLAISYTDHADVTYKTDQEMEKANVQYVSGNMFPVFGIQPAMGRFFSENDNLKPGAAPYAVLSYDYWTRRFGRDPNIIGRTFHYGDGVYEIVGVSEKKFTGSEPGVVVDLFVPTMMHRCAARPGCTWFRTLVAVKPGVAIEPLRAKIAAVTYAFEKNRLSGETGLWVMIADIVATALLPVKGRWPVAIWYSTTPRENKSVRGSSSSPRACSGDIYTAVPKISPAIVNGSSTVISD